MQIIVPLAGPDFERRDGLVKAEMDVQGQPLLRRALESRPWWRASIVDDSGLTFVLRDSPRSRQFAEQELARWYPRATRVHLSQETAGAAFSAAVGVMAVGDRTGPICIDLADILFEIDCDPRAEFRREDVLGGALITFPSSNPAYSYAELGEDGYVSRTAEKKVISTSASAGVYLFSSAALFLRSLAHAIEHRAELEHNGLMFVCPVLNGVIAAGLRVRAWSASQIVDVKMTTPAS